MTRSRWPHSGGFTLIELLVVISIIILVSAVTLPTIIPALTHRQVSESARILQAALVGARDAAIRANAPRGIRLMPDPIFNGSTAANGVLAASRLVSIEPAQDYTSGKVSIKAPTTNTPISTGGSPGFIPYPLEKDDQSSPPHAHPALRVEEERQVNGGGLPNERTSWYWNIRVGDKIRFHDSGRYYTIVGPMVISPTSAGNLGNPELFVNVGPPGTVSQLTRTYGAATLDVEYLYLVNGQDDDGDGFVDNGWDDLNNNGATPLSGNPSNNVDKLSEWSFETEQWLGPQAPPRLTLDQAYTIYRRPVPTQGARETALPPGVVIDMTTWNFATQERSRLPVDSNTKTVDIMLNQNGQVIPTTAYSSPAAFGSPFYHFWLSERADVYEPVNTTAGTAPNQYTYFLPMPSGTINDVDTTRFLKGERRLVTLFTRSGQVTTNAIETFNAADLNTPFYEPQLGTREAK